MHAVHDAIYAENPQTDTFFGLSDEQFEEVLTVNEIIWAPDGDAAFDDGGHVLQFDQGAAVRLIAFENSFDTRTLIGSISEVYLTAEEFYGTLESWNRAFETQWRNAVASSSRQVRQSRDKLDGSL